MNGIHDIPITTMTQMNIHCTHRIYTGCHYNNRHTQCRGCNRTNTYDTLQGETETTGVMYTVPRMTGIHNIPITIMIQPNILHTSYIKGAIKTQNIYIHSVTETQDIQGVTETTALYD